MMRHSVHCVIAGRDNAIEQFATAALPSWLQPGNLPAVRQAQGELVFCFYLHRADEQRLSALVREHDLTALGDVRLFFEDFENVRPVPMNSNFSVDPLDNAPAFGVAAILHQVRLCLAEDLMLLNMPADMVFGDGSLARIAELAALTNECITAPHLRVVDETFLNLWRHEPSPVANERLVELALRTLHPIWLNSRSELVESNSLFTGHTLQDLEDGHYAVNHRLPTVFAASFRDSDVQYLLRLSNFRFWDWQWPGKLMAENRVTSVAGSDLFFGAELTPIDVLRDTKLSPIKGEFIEHHLHHHVNQSFIFGLRSRTPVDLSAVQRSMIGDSS